AELRKELEGYTIFIVPYCHADWAWTYTREWHEERYALVYRDVLAILRENADFKWFMDTENEQFAPFRDRHPELLSELHQRLLEGRIGVSGGTICNPHPDRLGGESFIRNMTLGRRYFAHEFPGVDLSVLVLNDVIFGHTQLPQLARKAGYRYYRAWRPGEALDQKGVPRHFQFRGLDGTTILTSRGSYGGTYYGFPDNFEENWEGAIQCLAEEIRDAIVMTPVKLGWWSHGMDDGRPLRDIYEKPVDLLHFVELFNEREPAKLVFGTPKDYFTALEEHLDEIPVVQGPLDPVGWSYWYGQIGNESLRFLRCIADAALVAAETWHTLSCMFGHAYPDVQLGKLWRLLLKTCPHATLWLFEEDYQELLGDVKAVVRGAEELIGAALYPKAQRAASPADGKRIVVFNDQSWNRQEVVRFHIVFPARGTTDVKVVGPDGQVLRHQILDLEPYEDSTLKEATLAVETTVPACGYATLAVQELHSAAPSPAHSSTSVSDTFTILGEHVSLAFSNGILQAIQDHLNHVTYCQPDTLRFYRIEDTGPYHYGPIQEVIEVCDRTARWVADGELVAKVETEGCLGDHGVQQAILLDKRTGLVDITTVIESVGGDGFFRTEFALPYEGAIHVDIPFGVEPRDVLQEPYGCLERMRENVFWGSGWAAYSDGKKGCGLLIASGMQGFTFEPDRRVLGHTLLKVIRHPREGWERHETRLREGKGRQIFRYAFLPFTGDWRSAELMRLSQNWRRPLRAVKPLGPAGEAPTSHSWLKIEPNTLILSALYREQEHIFLRFYESVGQSTSAVITLPFAPESVSETDFLGNPIERKIDLDGVTLQTAVRSWEIVTLRLLP
ncbi:MAG: glycosyl hydrolase-related protein, partial [Candidatus Zipacnadales bacterium]